MFNSTLAGISSTIFFQNGVSDANQNKLLSTPAFASPEEESGDSNNDEAGEDTQGIQEEESGDSNNDEAGDDTQGIQEAAEKITTVNPSLTSSSEPPQNQQCPAGSPPGCYVKPPSSAKISCEPGKMIPKNVQGGPDGTMCIPIPINNLNNPNDVIGVQEQLPANSILTTTPTTQDSSIKAHLPANSILTTTTFDPGGKPTPASCEAQGATYNQGTGMCEDKQPAFDPGGKPTPASCEAQGTLFDPPTNTCKNPESIQDCAKIMQRYDPNQGKCVNSITS